MGGWSSPPSTGGGASLTAVASNIQFSTDNVYDIGFSGSANRPRIVYAGSQLNVGNGGMIMSATGLYRNGKYALLGGGSDGLVDFYNSAETVKGDLGLRTVRLVALTVSTLPSASTMGAGARAFVTDATSPTFGATASGGGSTATPVYSDGTNWKVG